MSNSVQPSSWLAASAGGGTASVYHTDAETIFTATPDSTHVFDHWEFEPYSGSSAAPGQWMPELSAALSNTRFANPSVTPRFTYDEQAHPEYNQAGIKGTAYFRTKPQCRITAEVDPRGVGCNVRVYGGIAGEVSQATFQPGEVAGVIAFPANDYIFVGWYEEGERVSAQLEYVFEADDDRVLIARFHLPTNLLVNSSDVGSPVRLVYDDVTGTGQLVADY